MCGRFTLRTPAHRLAEAFGVGELPNLPPRYNIAPTEDAAVVRPGPEGEARELAMLRWGLVPRWSHGALRATVVGSREGPSGESRLRLRA